jgi:hypothetical protein
VLVEIENGRMSQNANVLRGTQWTATPNGTETVNSLPEIAQGGFWPRLKSKFRWEKLTVAGREVKGFVVTPTIATILLSAILGVMGWAYKSSTSDQRETRDAVIRMETMLNERTHNFEREQDKMQQELKDERTLAKLQRDNQDKKLNDMEYTLKAKGVH